MLAGLDKRISEVLDPLLPSGSRVALLDFPNHCNVGDIAIWLGETRYLRERDLGAVYMCDAWSYSEPVLREAIGEGTILLHGGGNLGDLWPDYQRFRERVVRSFPDNAIVQLPQTIYFRDRGNLERARAAFDSHPNLTILARDEVSLDTARTAFSATSLLCPDMAFKLGPLKRPAKPEAPVLWLARQDIEAAGERAPRAMAGAEVADWPTALPQSRLRDLRYRALARLSRTLTPRLARSGVSGRRLTDAVRLSYDPRSRDLVRDGCRILARGRTVVTDRLHGHILCLLMGIPHVLLDNSYGKLASFHATWTRDSGSAEWASTPEEAAELAVALAADGSE